MGPRPTSEPPGSRDTSSGARSRWTLPPDRTCSGHVRGRVSVVGAGVVDEIAVTAG
jgi:hypothetical protein